MSSVQTDLHKYFKVKKSSKDLPGKGKIQSGHVSSKIALDGTREIQNNNDKVKVLPSNCLKNEINETKPFSKNSGNEAERSDTSDNINRPILQELPPEKVIEQKDIKLLEGHTKQEESDSQETHGINDQVEQCQSPSRKRKFQELEDDTEIKTSETQEESLSSYPTAKVKKSELICSPKAKKKLNLDGNSNQQGKLNPEDIKKQLGKCGRLDELRSRLLKLNQCEQKLNAFRSQNFKADKQNIPRSPVKSAKNAKRRTPVGSPFSSPIKNNFKSPIKAQTPLKDVKAGYSPKIKSFDSFDIEVPVSPRKTPTKPTTPVKKPCYERFRHLTEPFSSRQLQLPHRYQIVKEVFRAVDTIVSLLHNRQELITYTKLKPAVQEMLRKSFSESQLGQLKTVFPLAYFFSQEKIKNKGSYNSSTYQLVVKPNFNYKRDNAASRNLLEDLNTVGDEVTKYRKMDSVVLVERRHVFHSALLDILKKHHSKFLQSLDPPITLEGPVQRWHPEFPLEEIEPPSPSPLPQPPSSDAPETAKGVLDKAKNVFAVNNRMKDALEAVASSPKHSTPLRNCASSSAIDNSNVAAALKGVSLSLLEKIRAREAAKAAREMTRSTGASQELEMLSRLPELVRVLRSMFVTEKKAALPWESVTSKVTASHSGSLSTSEAESHLNLLMKEVPGWCTVHKVRSGTYLKVDKSRQLQDIIDKLHDIIKEKT